MKKTILFLSSTMLVGVLLLMLAACSASLSNTPVPTAVKLPNIVVPSTTPSPTITLTATPYIQLTATKISQVTVDPAHLTPQVQISPIATITASNPVGLTFNPNSDELIVIQDSKIEFFSTQNLGLRSTKYFDTQRLKIDTYGGGSTDNTSMAISANRQWFVLGQWEHYASRDNNIQRGVISVAQMGSGLIKTLGQDLPPSTMAAPFIRVFFVPDNQKVAGEMDSGNGEVHIWNIQDGKRLYTINSFAGLRSIDFSPDGTQYAVCANTGYIELREVATGKLKSNVGKFNQTSSQPNCGVAFNHEGSQMAFYGDEHIIHLWNALSYGALNNLPGHDALLSQVVFSPNDESIASMSNDGLVRVWNMKAHREVFTWAMTGVSFNWIRFSPDNRYLLGAGTDGIIRVWKADGGQLAAQFEGKQVAFSPKGDLIASYNSSGIVSLWQTKSVSR